MAKSQILSNNQFLSNFAIIFDHTLFFCFAFFISPIVSSIFPLQIHFLSNFCPCSVTSNHAHPPLHPHYRFYNFRSCGCTGAPPMASLLSSLINALPHIWSPKAGVSSPFDVFFTAPVCTCFSSEICLGSELVPHNLAHHCSLIFSPVGLTEDASVLLTQNWARNSGIRCSSCSLGEGRPRLDAVGKGQ